MDELCLADTASIVRDSARASESCPRAAPKNRQAAIPWYFVLGGRSLISVTLVRECKAQCNAFGTRKEPLTDIFRNLLSIQF
jgi:hypothetical protein